MMPRLPYAAVQLIQQVGEERENVEVTHGDPDGIDVIREISFDKATSKWLWDRISTKLDPRIAVGNYSRRTLTLTFQTSSPLADDSSPFDLSVPAKEAVQAPPDDGDDDDIPPLDSEKSEA